MEKITDVAIELIQWGILVAVLCIVVYGMYEVWRMWTII